MYSTTFTCIASWDRSKQPIRLTRASLGARSKTLKHYDNISFCGAKITFAGLFGSLCGANYVCMYGMDQPGKVANPARGQLNRENDIPLSPCVPENLVSRDGFSRPVPRQPAHLHTQAESGAYLRDSSRVPRRRPFMKPPYAIGSVPSLSGHAIAYRWC